MHEEVARIVGYELRSNLARHVQITSATLSGDLGNLKVLWIMQDGGPHERAAEVLTKAAAFVGRALRDTFNMRKTPRVVFHFDAERVRLDRVRELLDADPALQAAEEPTVDPDTKEPPDDALVDASSDAETAEAKGIGASLPLSDGSETPRA